MKKIIIIILIFVASINAHIIIENTHHEDWLPKNLLNIKDDFQNLSKLEDSYHHLLKITRIKFRYFPSSHSDFPASRTTNETEECLESSSEDFPEDLFTVEQRRQGAIILHFMLGVYCFTLLAIVCNDYFLPSVAVISEVLKLSPDIAAATFMAMATSAPELFVNIVGTFLTESDIGVGTVVGSSMFNTLGVAALGGLAAKSCIQLDWWPITRDCVIYICTVTMLVLMARDEKIEWYEAMIMLCFYVVYFIIMWQNQNIYRLVVKIIESVRRRSVEYSDSGSSSPPIATIMTPELTKEVGQGMDIEKAKDPDMEIHALEEGEGLYLFTFPHNSTTLTKIWWVYSWPIRFILKCTIPTCTTRHYLFPLSFIMCILWIGTNSYLVSWMITIIGATFKIPDFVMGVTFLAAGGCLPEAISIVIVVRKGGGGMGVSNSLGSNTLTILLSLGLPWFVKTMLGWKDNHSFIEMDSDSLFYTILALIFAVCILYITVSLFGYRLCKKVGIILISMYLLFLTTAIVLEMFLYSEEKLYPCDW